jgi:hypothetical protein
MYNLNSPHNYVDWYGYCKKQENIDAGCPDGMWDLTWEYPYRFMDSMKKGVVDVGEGVKDLAVLGYNYTTDGETREVVHEEIGKNTDNIEMAAGEYVDDPSLLLDDSITVACDFRDHIKEDPTRRITALTIESIGIWRLAKLGKLGKIGKYDLNKPNVVNELENLSQVKVLGRGSTGRTVPNNLNEQLAMKIAKHDPLATGKKIDDVPMTDSRWPGKDGWVKMQSIVEHTDASGNQYKINIHFVYNEVTGEFDDFKFKDN